MNVALLLSKRLGYGREMSAGETRARQSSGTVIAVIGISLTIIIMLLSVSVISGFKHEITAKLEGSNSQIMVMPHLDESDSTTDGIRLNDTLTAILKSVIPQAEIGLSITQPAVLKTDDAFLGLALKGASTPTFNKHIEQNLVEGSMPTYDMDQGVSEVAISSQSAKSLALKVGDKIPVHFLRDNNIRSRVMTVSGIFDTKFNEFDKALAVVPLEMLQRFNRVDSLTGSMIEISGLSDEEIDDASYALYDQLIQETVIKTQSSRILYDVTNVHLTCAQYYNWLNLLDTNVVVILLLMSIVSAFTLISSLFILILERVNTIGILKAIGASNTLIRKSFIYIAERLVIKGLLIGNAIGITIMYIQHYFKLIPLDADAYYLSYVPMEINWLSIVILNIAVVVLSAIILILPSHLISTLSPAKTIRFE